MEVVTRKAIVEDAELVAPLFDAYRVWYHQKADAEGALHFIIERLQHK